MVSWTRSNVGWDWILTIGYWLDHWIVVVCYRRDLMWLTDCFALAQRETSLEKRCCCKKEWELFRSKIMSAHEFKKIMCTGKWFIINIAIIHKNKSCPFWFHGNFNIIFQTFVQTIWTKTCQSRKDILILLKMFCSL